MSQSPRRAELSVGLFVLIGIAIVGGLIFRFSQQQTRPAGGYAITVEVTDATGIRSGVPVRLGGVDIGRVVGNPIWDDNYAQLSIPLEIQPSVRIPENSTAKVGTTGLLGGGYVRLLPPEQATGQFLEAGGRIVSEPAEHFSDLAGDADRALADLAETSLELRRAAERTGELIDRIEKGLLTEENMTHVSSILGEVKVVSTNLRVASEQIVPTLTETREALAEVGSAASGAKESFSQIEGGITDLTQTLAMTRPVVENFDTTVNALRKTLVATNTLLDQFNSDEGLAGAFLRDPALKRDFESFLGKLEKNGILFYPKESGSKSTEEKKLFPSGTRRQP